MANTAIRRLYRAVVDTWGLLLDDIQTVSAVERVLILAVIAILVQSSLYSSSATWLYEDQHWLPITTWTWTNLRVQYALSYGLWWIGHGTAVGHHLLNLGIHACVSVIVGLIGGRLWNSRPAAWASGVLFWLHPLAIPAIGYASAISEMLVTLGAVSVVYLLLHGWKWPWLIAAGSILIMTLFVKESAIGVLLIPALILIVRPVRWKDAWRWVVPLIPITAFTCWQFADRAIRHVLSVYQWKNWASEMLPQSDSAYQFFMQSFIPFGIAFQYDWVTWDTGADYMGLCAVLAALTWWYRRSIPVEAFAFLWVPALIGVRLLIPATNWPERAPELMYAQQWYPALPGTIWLIVSLGRRFCESCYPVHTFDEGSTL